MFPVLPALLLFIAFTIVLAISHIKIIYEHKRKVKLKKFTFKSIEQDNNKIAIEIFDQAPGPVPWPVIGNLVELGKYEVPFEAFTALAKRYGDIYSLFLGSTRCLVVNNLELIREVLNQNGRFFGGRPDFIRFHKLFGGDRNNCKLYLVCYDVHLLLPIYTL